MQVVEVMVRIGLQGWPGFQHGSLCIAPTDFVLGIRRLIIPLSHPVWLPRGHVFRVVRQETVPLATAPTARR